MIKNSTALVVTTAATLMLQSNVLAQPQLSGTPEELRGFLFPRPHTVNITGDGELTAYKDQANVSLMVTTEARDLAESMTQNQTLRNDLIETFITAGIPAEEIEAGSSG